MSYSQGTSANSAYFNTPLVCMCLVLAYPSPGCGRPRLALYTIPWPGTNIRTTAVIAGNIQNNILKILFNSVLSVSLINTQVCCRQFESMHAAILFRPKTALGLSPDPYMQTFTNLF